MAGLLSTLQAALRGDVSPRAAAAAIALGLVTRSLLRWLLRARANGPNLYWVRHEDVGGPRWKYALLGGSIALRFWPAGVAQRAFTKKARAVVGRPQGHAAFRMGPLFDRVLITNPADVRYVMIEQGEEFVKPAFMQVIASILGHNGLVLITDEAEHTRQFRNVSHAFAPAAVRAISETTVAEKTREAVAALENDVGTADGKQRSVQMHEWLTNTALGIILEAAFAIKNVAQYPAVLDFTSRLDLRPSVLMLLPPSLYLRLPLARHRADAAARAALATVLHPLLQSHRDSKKTSAAAAAANDDDDGKNKKLIDLLAENPSLSDIEILDHTSTFVMAGHETTANGLNWLLYMLATHPEVQATLAEELSTAFSRDVMPSLDTVQKLPYLDAVVSESLRLRSPVLGAARCAVRDHVLPGSGTYIPAGTDVIVPSYVLHVDPNVWGADAEEFRPERWIDDPGLKQRVQGSSYVPFAAGKRACIGKELALNEMLTITAAVVRRFVLTWPEGEEPPTAMNGIVVRPKEPFKLQLAKRTE